jgi:hypothetical protein
VKRIAGTGTAGALIEGSLTYLSDEHLKSARERVERILAEVPQRKPGYQLLQMPLLYGEHWQRESQAKKLAGTVGEFGKQPWLPPDVPLVDGIFSFRSGIYPEHKNIQTKITLDSDWSEWTTPPRCWPVCRHTGPCEPTDDDDKPRDDDDLDTDRGWIPEGREELPDDWFEYRELPKGYVTKFDHRKRLADYRTDRHGRWYHKDFEPSWTWSSSSRRVPEWFQLEDDGNVWVDDGVGSGGRTRGALYDGAKQLDDEINTMQPGSWGVFRWADRSLALLRCAVRGCPNEVRVDLRRYCSDEHRLAGANQVRRPRRRKSRNWPVDGELRWSQTRGQWSSHWYVQSSPEPGECWADEPWPWPFDPSYADPTADKALRIVTGT